MTNINICFSSDMHPYNCDGAGRCEHCDRQTTKFHKVSKCLFCRDDYARRRSIRKAKQAPAVV